MKNATLVLMVIAIACCLVVSPEASAKNDRYSLTGPVTYGENVLKNMTMAPVVQTNSSQPNRTIVDPNGGRFSVDSFFDVFTELTLEQGQSYRVESFFGPGSKRCVWG